MFSTSSTRVLSDRQTSDNKQPDQEMATKTAGFVERVITDANGHYAFAIMENAQKIGLQTSGFCGCWIPPIAVKQYNLHPRKGMMLKQKKTAKTGKRRTPKQIEADKKKRRATAHFVTFLMRSKLNIDASDAVIVFNPLKNPSLFNLGGYALTKTWGTEGAERIQSEAAYQYFTFDEPYRPTFEFFDIKSELVARALVDFLRQTEAKTIFVIGDSYAKDTQNLPIFINAVLTWLQSGL